MSATDKLAEFISETTYDDLPADVVKKAKRCLVNVIAVSIAGSQSRVGDHVVTYAKSQYDPDGSATVVGHGASSLEGAALANGTFPSVHHYDDTFVSVLMHPSASSFPAALGASEMEDSSGREFLTGYVVGIEAAFNIGRSLDPAHRDYGWHGTGTVGSFGATAAAATVMDLSPSEVEAALGIVASGSSSLRRNIGTDTNQLHTGHAAQIGVRAAILAQNGFTSDSGILEGDQGYGPLMKPTEEFDPDDIVNALGETWGTMDIGFKPYPSASISHSALEALLRTLDDEGLTGNDVESLQVRLDPSLSDILSPAYPERGSSAPASIKYCLAVALDRGKAEITDFTDEAVADSGIQSQWEKISCDFSSELGDDYHKKGAQIVLTTTEGEELFAQEKVPPGGPDKPLSEKRLDEKFIECTSTAASAPSAGDIRDAIDDLTESNDFDRFVGVLQRVE